MHWRSYTTDPALAGFTPREDGPARILVRRGFEASAPLLGLHGDPPSEERVDGGRAAHPVLVLPGGMRAVVRRYHRGGALRHLNRATYFLGHRAFHELLATERAGAGGVRVPTVLAAAERRTGIGYAAWLATAWIGGAVESARWMETAPEGERRAMLREAGRQAGRMHAAGVAHPDLNLRNLLVSPAEAGAAGGDGGKTTMDGGSAEAPTVHLIDFDSARLYPGSVPAARRRADIERLARSVRKLRAPVGEEEWRAFAEGYGPAWPFSPAETAARLLRIPR
jgi:3-deoxy-D-manno-octulosonic acid kinase